MKTIYGIDVGLSNSGSYEHFYSVETKEQAHKIVDELEKLKIPAFLYPMDIVDEESIDVEVCYFVTIGKNAMIKNLEYFPEAYYEPERYGLDFNVGDKKDNEHQISFSYRTSLDNLMRQREIIIGKIEDFMDRVFKDTDFSTLVDLTEDELVGFILPFYRKEEKI